MQRRPTSPPLPAKILAVSEFSGQIAAETTAFILTFPANACGSGRFGEIGVRRGRFGKSGAVRPLALLPIARLVARHNPCDVNCYNSLNTAGQHVATIGLDEGLGMWKIHLVRCQDLEFFCPTRESAFSAWHHEFDSETGLPIDNKSEYADLPDHKLM